MKYAVIDIGTNSTRLFVAQGENGIQKKITKELETTRLGEGIDSSLTIQPQPMLRTANAIENFTNTALSFGVERDKIFIYATAMVREATNKDEFISLVKEKTAITLEVIPGAIEGKIAFMGAAGKKQNYAVIDIGGGSTEVVTNLEDNFKALSQKIGGVRLKEKFETPDGKVDISPAKEFVLNNFIADYADITDVKNAAGLIGVSGTPTTFASFALGIKTYLPDKIQNFVLTREKLNELLNTLASFTTKQRRAYSGDFAPRADIIVYGGIILEAFMEYYGFESILVSDADSLEGFLEYKTGLKQEN